MCARRGSRGGVLARSGKPSLPPAEKAAGSPAPPSHCTARASPRQCTAWRELLRLARLPPQRVVSGLPPPLSSKGRSHKTPRLLLGSADWLASREGLNMLLSLPPSFPPQPKERFPVSSLGREEEREHRLSRWHSGISLCLELGILLPQRSFPAAVLRALPPGRSSS